MMFINHNIASSRNLCGAHKFVWHHHAVQLRFTSEPLADQTVAL